MSFTMKVYYPSETTYYRIPHDVERVKMYVTDGEDADYRYRGDSSGKVRRVVVETGEPRPEVYRAFPDHQTPLDRAHQFFWRFLNPMLSDSKFSTLFGNTLAWCNGTGAGVRHNWITGANADKKDIAFDAARFCGGAIIPGVRSGGVVQLKSLLLSQTIPEPSECIAHPEWGFWYWGTSINPQGEVNLIKRLGIDGQYYPVRVANITSQPISILADELHELPEGFFPEATWLS